MTIFHRIIDWLDAIENPAGKTEQERGQAELSRLGLVNDDPNPAHMSRTSTLAGAPSFSKPVSTVTRLVVLLGAGTIASLALIFG